MPNFSQLIEEKLKTPPAEYIPRIQRLIGEIEEKITHRPLVVYAADISKSHPAVPNLIYPLDKTMFADLLDSVGGNEAVDVLLQSPGGYPDATEQLVEMLRGRFKSVHFYVPHTAKSAATMMICSGNKVFMDDRSELGPIDPQIRIPKGSGVFIDVPAQAYLDGFDQLKHRVDQEGKLSGAYVPVLNQVDVSILQVCLNAIEHSKVLVRQWLQTYMFAGLDDAESRAKALAEKLSDHRAFLSHGRPLGIRQAQELGLIVEDLRAQPELQAKIWELYCRIELLFDGTPWVKIFASKEFMVGKQVPREQVIQLQPPPAPKPVPPAQPTPVSPGVQGKRDKKKKR